MAAEWSVVCCVLASLPSLYAIQRDEFISDGIHSRMLGGPEISGVVLCLLAPAATLSLGGTLLKSRWSPFHMLLGFCLGYLAWKLLLEASIAYT
jgi:hypothetical protein